MAAAAVGEDEEGMAVPSAQLPLPQRQLGPELCLRRDSEHTTPRAPSLTQNTDQAPHSIRKGHFLPPRGCKFIFPQVSKKCSVFWWWFILSFSLPCLLESHLQCSESLIFHLSLFPMSSFSPNAFILAGDRHKPSRGGKMIWRNNQRPQGCSR